MIEMIKTLAFRFGVVYFWLYVTYDWVPGLLDFVWNPVATWVGENVLGMQNLIGVMSNGSGDQTEHWVLALTFVVLAILACAGWTAADRGRATHPRLAAWTTVAARYWLGMIMVGYGLAKVIPTQFPYPDYVRLTDTYGESSPMGLMWTFMGFSPLYGAFAGGLEVLGGVLLFWRRTTTLGALVCVGVLANIVMLNLGYDVCVKLFSSHLLVVALVLAGQDAERLIGVLVLGRAVPARLTPPLTTTVRGHRIRWAVKGLFLLYMTHTVVQRISWSRELAEPDPRAGVFDVTEHQVTCESEDPCDTELRWRRLVVGRQGWEAAVEPLQGPRTKYRSTIDDYEFVLTSLDGGPFMRFDYEEPVEGALILEGSFGGAEHRITLERVDDPEFLLVDRGFRWVNESPFNY
jgi:hypothetical protein